MYYDYNYSLRPILLFANTDVSRHILVVDTSILMKSNMDRKEYYSFLLYLSQQLGYFYPVGESKSVETAKVFLRAAGPWFMHACTSRSSFLLSSREHGKYSKTRFTEHVRSTRLLPGTEAVDRFTGARTHTRRRLPVDLYHELARKY
jgi:hypothetical protein